MNDTNNLSIINRESLLEFIDGFDYVTEKYGLTPEHFASKDFDKIYRRLERHELHDYPITLIQREYSTTYENVRLIYTEENVVRDMMELFANTRENVVRQFININGIERLFSEKYFDFEWDMHTRIKYDEAAHDYYRDHFIHQIRDFYATMVLLDDSKYNFLAEAIEEVKMRTSDVIPSYINSAVNSCLHDIQHYEREKTLYEDVFFSLDVEFNKKLNRALNTQKYITLDENDKIIYKKTKIESIMESIKKNRVTFESDWNDYLYKTIFTYFMKLACAMSTLFHDIGYPIEHNAKFNERLTEYISLLYSFNDTGSNFNRIASLLDSSLFFKIIPHDEIKSRLEKKDHGVYSAVTFLLHFYENGSFDGFHDTIKRAAAEVAAVAMYDHHLQYRAVNKENESDKYYRPYYKKNPVSFLLRLCDDLQEWERVYYDYKYTPAIRLCDICKTPVVSVKDPGQYKQNKNGKLEWKPEQYKNICLCSRELDGITAQNCYKPINIVFPNFSFRRERISDLTIQKITIVNTCDKMTVKQKAAHEQDVTIKLSYKPFKLLQMCCTSATFSKFRIKDLSKLKQMLDGQFNKTKLKLEYFITSNPLMLKAKIIEKYEKLKLKYEKFRENKSIELGVCIDEIDKRYDLNICEIEDKIDEIYKENGIIDFLNTDNHDLYKDAMTNLKLQIKERFHIYKAMNKYYNTLITEPVDYITAESDWDKEVYKKVYKTQPVEMLLFDAKVQYNRLADIYINKYINKYDSYIDIFKAEYKKCSKDFISTNKESYKKYKDIDSDYFYAMVNAYCSMEISPYEVVPFNLGSTEVLLDFYTDMALYHKLSKDIEDILKCVENQSAN